LNAALLEYYRCAESLANFRVTEELSQDSGYFRFGAEQLYGRTASGFRSSRPEAAQYDTLRDATHHGCIVLLPFDPNEVIANLRLERYASGHRLASLSRAGRLLRNFYYLLRPMLHVSVRQQLQRAWVHDWQRLRFPHWPVDTTVEDLNRQLLHRAMRVHGLEEIPFIWFWPRGAGGCMILTHDVEARPGLKFCSDLMDLDDAFGFKASFQLIPAGRYHLEPAVVDDIRRRGFEVNLQDLSHDGHLFRERSEFLKRAEEINRYAEQYGARGFRAAVLYRNPDWVDSLQFSYDMSVPNVAHLDPQRGGCCTVMPYFIGDKVELPLTTVQDYTLFHLLNDYSLELWKQQVDTILSRNGMMSFLAHPDYVIERRGREVYRELLGYLREVVAERRVWSALPGEVEQWWRQRSKMRLVQRGSAWEIEGEGAERARVATARLAGDHLEYQVKADL
jgi:hypothetical protein